VVEVVEAETLLAVVVADVRVVVAGRGAPLPAYADACCQKTVVLSGENTGLRAEDRCIAR